MKKKKKILLVVDNEKWAFFNIASNFQKELSKEYDVDILAMTTIDGNTANLFMYAKDYDLIHLFWRGLLLDIDIDYTKSYIYNMGYSLKEFADKFIKNKKITTAVYDHKYIDQKIINKYTKYASDYYTCSTILDDIYHKLNLKKYPSTIITDGVDLKRFKPKKNKYRNIKNRTLVIGWTGNSKWDGQEDHKGLNTIIKPAIEEMKKEGYNIKLSLADSNEKMRSKDEMVEYYKGIDLYVCCSISEGTPNPILESFACGIPVISTNVGIVSELFGKNQQKYIMEERSVKELQNKIKLFLKNIDTIEEISNENLEIIKKWSWKNKAEDFKQFIEKQL